MQGQRLGHLVGQLDVAAQVGQLVLARGEATVVVEAGLADADHLVGVASSQTSAHIASSTVGRDVRMDAGRGAQAMAAHELEPAVRRRAGPRPE